MTLFVGRSKYDKKVHYLWSRDEETYLRICSLHPVGDSLIRGREVDCENCLARRDDDQWRAEAVVL